MISRLLLVFALLATGLFPGCSAEYVGLNRSPVAVAGADMTVVVDNQVEIDGSESFDPDGEPLEYIWSLVAAPSTGKAELASLRGETTSLTPDAAGAWLVRLVVFDGMLVSQPDLVRILAFEEATECQTDADCDNGDPCTSSHTCQNGSCVHGATDKDSDSDGYLDGECPGGTDCDDSDASIHPGAAEGPPGDATCSDGVDNDCDGNSDGAETGCLDCTQDSECDDGNVCTQDDCLPSGVCDNPPVQDGTACDDGDPCSSQDSCQSGGCTSGDTDKDSDGDGYRDENCPGGNDCDDSTTDANPGLSEGPGGSAFCGDLLDNDCDGQTDDDDPGCATDWWNTDWTRRRKLTFDNSGQPENLDSFPLLVKLNSSRIDYTQTRNSGEDLRFVDEDDQTVLAHEIEQWTEGGESIVWVKIPRINSGSIDDFIWMYYGNSNGQAQQDPAAVWSAGYRAVWHLNEQVNDENNGASHTDSTGNNNTGTQYGNNDHTGMMAEGQEFDGVDDYIEIAASGFTGFNRAITIEAWADLYEVVSDFPHVIGAGPPGSGRSWQIWWDPGTNGWGGRLSCNGKQGYVSSNLGAVGGWDYVVLRYDGSNISIFIDGDWGGSTGENEALDPLGSPLWIGINHNLTPRMFKGSIDEVRISDVDRSDRWIKAQHLSMTDAFITYGSEEIR
jgi:hypothetical protein